MFIALRKIFLMTLNKLYVVSVMDLDNNHNHFCIYCGSKLMPNQSFCSKCGREVYNHQPQINSVYSSQNDKLKKIEHEYNSKQGKAMQLIGNFLSQDPVEYGKFESTIKKSNQLFSNQLFVVKKMMELDMDDNELLKQEIDNKIDVLDSFNDKLEELINELVIKISSNKNDDEEINNLFNDMDELIDSVKKY